MVRNNEELNQVMYPDRESTFDPIEEKQLRHNGSGCYDPTAYRAIKNIEQHESEEWERHHKLIGCLLRICELSGFSLEERIVVRDNRTGKVWR